MVVIPYRGMSSTLLDLYRWVLAGREKSPRGQRILEIRDLAVSFAADQPPLTSFEARNLNLAYAKQEWLWYLRADPYDASIMQHAKMWQKLQQPDGMFYSNYGQYIFGPVPQTSQFQYVVDTLVMDPHSRRASMTLLKREHLYHDNSDVVCTYAINFSIDTLLSGVQMLDMTVMMRSNDVVFGFTNDAFCFWNLMEFVYQCVKLHIPTLLRGTYTHFTNSMHVYERHFDMVKRIVSEGLGGYWLIEVPTPTVEEVWALVHGRGNLEASSGKYTDWLKAIE